MSSKFSFIMRTQLGSGRTSEAVLAHTENRVRASMLRNRFITLAGGTLPERRCKQVKVVDIDLERFAVFNLDNRLAPKKGQIFKSLDALADAMDANPVTLRAGISAARKNKAQKVTVRGVTYAYVA